jgi:hypothetical protein
MPFPHADERPEGFALTAKPEILATNKGTGALFCIGDRVLFVGHQGRSILLIDLSYCSAGEVEETLRAVPELVTTHPRASVLVLTDFTGASFDAEAIRVVKETAVFNKPFVKKSAFTGIESFPADFYEDLKSFSRREFPPFETRVEALTWLVKD